MALSEFGWANGADTWDTITLQQFERLRTEGSSDSGTDTPSRPKQQPKRRPQPPRSKDDRRSRRQGRSTTAGS